MERDPGSASVPGLTSSEDSFWFVADLKGARAARATALIHWDTSEDLDVEIRDDKGEMITGAQDLPGEDEYVSFDVENGKRYQVVAVGFINAQTDYKGFLWVRSVSGRAFNGPGSLVYKKRDVLATLDIPINIVFVGFDPAEVAANKQTVLDKLPPAFRPVIRTQSTLGGGTVRRQPATSSQVAFEPMEFRYKYNLITTPESYNRALFAAAKKATTSGEFQLAFDRDYIERYNLRALASARGPTRSSPRGRRWTSSMGSRSRTGSRHTPRPASTSISSKPANGYTYFVIDSFRPSYAGEYFNLNRYHNFKVMNDLTTDPDSGAQSGFDWGRVWGGRYRFLMLDVGAAPNSWEAPVALANTKIFRLEGNGDSSLVRPADLALQQRNRGVLLARRRGRAERALVPVHPRLSVPAAPLQEVHPRGEHVARRGRVRAVAVEVREPVQGQARHRRVQRLDPVRRIRRLLSSSSTCRLGIPSRMRSMQASRDRCRDFRCPFAVNTKPVMQLVNANRAEYAPLEPGAFTIPVINVVFQAPLHVQPSGDHRRRRRG